MTDSTPAIAYRRLMVPVDMRHKGQSDQSVRTACALSAASGAELIMMTVANPLGTHLADTPDKQKEAFEAWTAEMSGELGCELTPAFRSHESPEAAILQETRERGVDLIVMASHDPRLSDHLIGSHASHIARDAPCSVLVVR